MRYYGPEQRAEAVARASIIGAKVASRELGIPIRTLYNWLRSPSPEMAVVRHEAALTLIEEYAQLERAALDRVRETLPTAPAHHAARALEVIAEHRALLAGEATARTESAILSVNVSEYEALLNDMDPVNYRLMLASLAAYGDESVVSNIIEALRRLTPEQAAELDARMADVDRPLGYDDEAHGVYGTLPNGGTMYFTPDDERWQTGELIRRFDPLKGPPKRLTDGH